MSRARNLKVTELESRLAPARLRVQFDFRFDDTGFFRNNPERIAVLQAAADNVVARFEDDLSPIPLPYPNGGNSWKAQFIHPSDIAEHQEEITNLVVPADTIIIFVGAHDMLGDGLLKVSSERVATGSQEWINLVYGRLQPNSFGPTATDFSPWGGSLAFDLINNWHFGMDLPGNDNEFDLYTVAQNGVMHILGFGTSEAWGALSATGSFLGTNAVASYGTGVPMTSGKFEWAEDVLSGGARTPMDDEFEDGERVALTPLDLAAMKDIGWVAAGTTPPPPNIPQPPTIPPTVIPPGLRLVAFGAGGGASAKSAVTLNEASTLTEATRFSPFGTDLFGGTRVATADMNGDDVEDLIVGPGPGRATEVRIYSGATVAVNPNGSLLRVIPAFETSFVGGIYLAVGDVTGDGVPDVALGPDDGGGPRVRLFDGVTFEQLADFFAIEDPNFRGGIRLAMGDIDGDDTADLIVAAGKGGGPRVAAFNGLSLRPGQTPEKLFNDFFIFEETLRNGVFIATGDLNADGSDDLIAGGGPGGGPRVYALSGLALTTTSNHVQLANFFAGDEDSRGGIRLAVDDFDRDGRADIYAGAGTQTLPLVTVYQGSQIPTNGTPPTFLQYRIFDTDFIGGVFVG